MPRTSRFGDLLHIGYPTADCVLLASLDAFFAFFCHLAEVNIGSCNYWILVVFVSMCICDLEGPKIEQRLTSILELFFLSFFLRIYSYIYRIIQVYRWGARWSLVNPQNTGDAKTLDVQPFSGLPNPSPDVCPLQHRVSTCAGPMGITSTSSRFSQRHQLPGEGTDGNPNLQVYFHKWRQLSH
jgi:hypothetical protein